MFVYITALIFEKLCELLKLELIKHITCSYTYIWVSFSFFFWENAFVSSWIYTHTHPVSYTQTHTRAHTHTDTHTRARTYTHTHTSKRWHIHLGDHGRTYSLLTYKLVHASQNKHKRTDQTYGLVCKHVFNHKEQQILWSFLLKNEKKCCCKCQVT